MNAFDTRNQRGYSLAEVLVAIAIFVIIVIAALTMYDRSSRTFRSGVEASNLQQGTRVAFEKMLADLRMAGFDFDRDGTPSVTNQYQQPDEQIEFISSNAVTFRGNFDYDVATIACSDPSDPLQCDNGRELDYQPEDSEFPVVTTGNDEIVTYALRSNNAAANDDNIVFFADVSKPRSAYPGGSAEGRVTIPRVDLSNNNPPYTLYRFTLTDAGGLTETPIAENIRSLTFTYYEDSTGRQQLTDLADTPEVYTSAELFTEVGGLGQYDPSDPNAANPRRLIRQKIRAIRVVLVGMNENPDRAYTDPADTIAPNYRKYQLESLVVPRNAGRRGAIEQEYRAPASPSITRICYGYCGLAYIEWQAAAGGAGVGAADQYAVLMTTNPASGFGTIVYVGNVLSAYVSVPNPGQAYFFRVEAINSYGSAISTTTPSGVTGLSTVNLTTPNVPTNLSASGGGSVAAERNQITLRWKAPTGVAAGLPACNNGTTPPATAPYAEIKGWQIDRRLVSDSSASAWKSVVTETTPAASAPNFNQFSGDVTWVDTTVANCENYEYRIRTVESCSGAASASGISNVSAYATVQGRANSTTTPARPSTATATGTCPPPTGQTTCTINLTWPAVTTDNNTPGGPLTVHTYKLTRHRRHSSAPSYDVTLDPVTIDYTTPGAVFNPVVGPTSITYTDTPVYADASQPTLSATGYYFEYTVTATSCSNDSLASMTTKYPCAFGAGPIVASISGTVVEGNGSQASPWVVTEGGDLRIEAQGSRDLEYLQATYVGQSGTTILHTREGTFDTAVFDLPDLPTGGTAAITVVLRDTEDCLFTNTYYVEESASNCCLQPLIVTPPTIRLVDDSADTIRYQLLNTCGSTLTIQEVVVNWNPNYENGANLRVAYPSALNQTTPTENSSNANSSPASLSKPNGALATIPIDTSAATDDYYILLKFSKDFGTTSPVQSICVKYLVGTDTQTRTCRIDPSPAPTVDTCP